MVKKYILLLLLLLLRSVAASDYIAVVRAGIENDPRIREKRILVDKAELRKKMITHAAILPRFEATAGIGPAPAYSAVEDSSGLFVEKYDFGTLRPLVGTEISMVQPMNFKRLQYARDAAESGIGLARQEVRNLELETSCNLQHYCFQYGYALQMKKLAEETKNDLRKAVVRVEAALADEEDGVTGEDLYEVKWYVLKAEEGILKAQQGLQATGKIILFSTDSDSTILSGLTLDKRNEAIPPLEELLRIQNTRCPDLQKLALGIAARTAVARLRKAEMYPDVYLAGNCKMTRTLRGSENEQTGLSRLLDPFDKTDAMLGIGMRFSFNVWSSRDNYSAAMLELEELKRTDAYAKDGLALKLETIYLEVMTGRDRIQTAETSVRTARTWLNSALMKYDLDQTRTRPLFKAYEKYIESQTAYYDAVRDYNGAVADLITSTGLTPDEFISLPSRNGKENK